MRYEESVNPLKMKLYVWLWIKAISRCSAVAICVYLIPVLITWPTRQLDFAAYAMVLGYLFCVVLACVLFFMIGLYKPIVNIYSICLTEDGLERIDLGGRRALFPRESVEWNVADFLISLLLIGVPVSKCVVLTHGKEQTVVGIGNDQFERVVEFLRESEYSGGERIPGPILETIFFTCSVFCYTGLFCLLTYLEFKADIRWIVIPIVSLLVLIQCFARIFAR